MIAETIKPVGSAKVAVLLALSLWAFTPTGARSQAESDHLQFDIRKGEIIVELKPGSSIDSVNSRHNTSTVRRIYGTNFYRLRIPANKREKKWRKRLSRDVDVLSASLNPVVTSPITAFGRSQMGFPDGYAQLGVTFQDFQSQAELSGLLGLGAVRLRSTGRGVVVAVIDTGVDRTHPFLASRLWEDSRADGEIEGDKIDNDGDGLVDDCYGWDFVDDDNDPNEKAEDTSETVAGHGTFIAGLIALIAPGSQVLPVRAFQADGLSDAFTVAGAIKYAADHGAHVINLSFGSPETPEVLQEAIAYARAKGAILVAAVGNDNTELKPQFPASSLEAMGVAAIDLMSQKAHFSNYGQDVNVTAPGVALISAFPGGSYATWSGTSFAAPLTSAEAALILAAYPRHQETERTIEETAVDIDYLNPGFEKKLGKGRINPLAALQTILTRVNAYSQIQSHVTLSRAQNESTAGGEAAVLITASDQRLRVALSGLDSRAAYELYVNGVLVTTGSSASKSDATSFGEFKIVFSTNPSQGQLPLPAELNPVTTIKRVEVRDMTGRLVLQGEFKRIIGGVGVAAQVIEKEARLLSTFGLNNLGGRAEARITKDRQSLIIVADGLAAGAVYHILVDGVSIRVAAADDGFLRADFTSDGSSGLVLPVQLRPVTNISHVAVRDAFGQIVLQGDFRPGGDDIGALVTGAARENR